MIQINCTNCKSLLQIDDAFAGGVCRCRHCGTIQTVPKRLKATSVAGAEAPESNGNGQNSSSKSLYQKRGAVETVGSGTGLDDLAGIVASSGLSSSRLQKKTPPPAAATAAGPAWDKKIVAIVASAGGLIVLLLGVIISMAVRDRAGGDQLAGANGTAVTPGQPPTVSAGGVGGNGNRPVAPRVEKTPSFLGLPLPDGSVAFVLDHGTFSGEEDRFQLMRSALVNALRTLRPDQQFQVVFFGRGKEPAQAWPASGLAPATPQNVAECQEKLLDSISASGATEEKAALTTALSSRPQAVVLIPIKGFDDASFAGRVIGQRAAANSRAKFYCFTLGNSQLTGELRRIAQSTGGEYRHIPIEELRRFAAAE
jgi:hypothetical protein